jgi:hypothetical protein
MALRVIRILGVKSKAHSTQSIEKKDHRVSKIGCGPAVTM